MQPYIIFYDDICVLCSRSVQFIYRHDKKGKFYFAPLDSETFRQTREQSTGSSDHSYNKAFAADRHGGTGSVILHMKGRFYTRSSAALRIIARLRFPLPLLAVGWLIPRFLRNAIYDMIARNRYGWFGKLDACFMPRGGLKKRILE